MITYPSSLSIIFASSQAILAKGAGLIVEVIECHSSPSHLLRGQLDVPSPMKAMHCLRDLQRTSCALPLRQAGWRLSLRRVRVFPRKNSCLLDKDNVYIYRKPPELESISYYGDYKQNCKDIMQKAGKSSFLREIVTSIFILFGSQLFPSSNLLFKNIKVLCVSRCTM